MKTLQQVLTLMLVLLVLVATTYAQDKESRDVYERVKELSQKSALYEDMQQVSSAEKQAVQKERDRYAKPLSFPARRTEPSPFAFTGEISVGAANTIKTIKQAMDSLNLVGVSGPTTFLLTDAAYTESGMLVLPVIGGSSTNTVTIKPDVGKTPVVSVTSSNLYGGGIVLSAVSYFTIDGTAKSGTAGARNLTIQFDATQTFPTSSLEAPIRMRDGCSSVTVKNTKVLGMYTTSSSATATGGTPAISVTTTVGPNTGIAIQNCLIAKASYGIYSLGVINADGDPSPMDASWTISDNDIGGAFGEDYIIRMGMLLQALRNSTISGNDVMGVHMPSTFATTTRAAGITIFDSYRNNIINNVVDDVFHAKTSSSSQTRVYGIQVWAPAAHVSYYNPAYDEPYHVAWGGIRTSNRFINNAVSRIESKGNTYFREFGIMSVGSRHDTLVHNSVSFAGTPISNNGSNTLGFFFSGMYGTFTGRQRCYNNIVSMARTQTGGQAVIANGQAGDYRDPSNHNVYYFTSAGDIMWDALFGGMVYHSLGEMVSSYAYAVDGASLNQNPYFTSASDLHLDPAQPSAARGAGAFYPSVPTDHDGQAHTLARTDAGYDQDAVALPTLHDVSATSIDNPTSSGIPLGIAFTPFSVTVHNETNSSEATVTVKLKVYNPSSTLVYDKSTTTSLTALETKGLDFTDSFTPSVIGVHTMKLIASVAGDIDALDDTVTANLPVAGQEAIPYSKNWNDGNAGGWAGTNDWALGDVTSTKLGGPRGATGYAWFTVPGETGDHYTEGGVTNFLYSPFFNFTSVTTAYLNFYQSINTEVEWDRSIMYYSIDTGKTWTKLGILNDPNGVNWYNEATYTAAASGHGNDCFDEVTATRLGVSEVGDPGIWTSNGDDCGAPTHGPDGYVFVQIKLPAAIMGKTYVRFRYLAFSDASAAFDGWAIDDFAITLTTTTGSISGKKFFDKRGNGTYDPSQGDTLSAGVIIQATSGSSVYDTTDASGAYSFTGLNPGSWVVKEKTIPAGYTTTVPVATYYNVDILPGGTTVHTGKDFGNWAAKITGTKFQDTDNDAVKDGTEPGLSGWVIELRKDSVTGSLVRSDTTDSNGNYEINPPRGTFFLTEVLQDGWRATLPSTGYYTGVTTDSISGNTNITGKNFGNWEYGIIRVDLTIDLDGDGTIDGGDVLPLPLGTYADFTVTKNGLPYSVETLGNGVTSFTIDGLNPGFYRVEQTGVPAGWTETSGGIKTTAVFSSGTSATHKYLDFYLNTISGTKFDDTNGDGVKDSGEPGLPDWVINLTGAATSSETTDADGNYSFTGLGPGSYTVSETQKSGWTRTKPSGAGTYSVTANGSPLAANATGKDFGNFKLITISGTKYKDQNANGTWDSWEDPEAGWTINFTQTGTLSATTGSNGEYTITDVGPGTGTLSETVQSGWLQTEPSGGTYSIDPVSGVNVTGKNFGNFKQNDSTKYRTFTATQFAGTDQKKKIKQKPGKKPITAPPNTANLIDDLVKAKSVVLKIGLSGQTNAGGKTKAYLEVTKQANAYKTFNDKGAVHTGAARGFDVDIKGKLMLKKWKSMSAKKKNSTLVANLLAMRINLAASQYVNTTPGLGSLIYSDPGHSLDGMSIDQIMSKADSVMTNWEGIPFNVYVELDTVIAKINTAFASTSVGDTTATGGWMSSKLRWEAYTSITSVSFLRTDPRAVPEVRPSVPQEAIPSVYALGQNYPNPFNPTTYIQFDLPEPAMVTLKIYNLLGQEVVTLLDREYYDEGSEEVEFDATELPSGVYLYHLVADGVSEDEDGNISTSQSFTQIKKMVLLK